MICLIEALTTVICHLESGSTAQAPVTHCWYGCEQPWQGAPAVPHALLVFPGMQVLPWQQPDVQLPGLQPPPPTQTWLVQV